MSPEARLGGLLILVYFSLKMGKLGLGPGGGYALYLELDDAVGLTQEGEVLVAGIPVGLVERIELEDSKAVLTLRIHEDVVLPVDTTASLRTHGVLGEKYVEVQPGSATQRLGDGDHLRAGVPPGDLDRLVSRLNDISQDVKVVTARLANVFGTREAEDDLRDLLTGLRDAAVGLREVVTENREALRTSLENALELTAELRDLLEANRENLDETLANSRSFTKTLAERAPGIAANLESLTGDLSEVVADNRENLSETLGNLAEATGQFASTLRSVESLMQALGSNEGTLGRLIQDDALYDDLSGSMADLRSLLDRLQQGEGTLGKLLTDDAAYAELTGSLENFRVITDKINRGEGTLGKLVNEETVYENVNETLESISGFVAGANRFEFELGYRGEYLTDLQETKSYLSLEIRPRQNRFYYFALVDDPRGDEETEKTETVTEVEGGETVVVRQDETKTRDRLKVSAQMGTRFSFLTLRGGIFESTGGVGADVDFWSERLRLTFEAFDFARDRGPAHLKMAARWKFLKHAIVTAGLDDFMDDHGRADYFVGGGLHFLDEDLKFLLSPAASAAGGAR
jgi:phospholipid/cholesterol/gamma-HCH transport system substrate-binding protein